MQTEYQISRSSRRCAALDRPLQPSESYYSVVIENDESWKRVDISSEGWDGPPEGAVGWWKNTMPAHENRKLKLAPDEVLLDLLRRPPEHEAQTAVRYLLALLLLRRRVVKPVETIPLSEDELASESEGDGQAMELEDPDDGSTIEVEYWEATAEGIAEAQAALVELVYCEAD